MPMVQERIRAIFGRDPDTSVRPDEAVALGASVEAARLQLEEGTGLVLDQAAREYLEAMTVTDVSAHSLGVSVFTGTGPSGTKHLEILLARNSPLPQEASKVFFTRHPGETRVVVPILEGEGPDPDQTTRIGQVVIDGLPPGRAAYQPVTVTMAYNRDGILEVTARDEESATAVTTTIERSGSTTAAMADRATAAVTNLVVH